MSKSDHSSRIHPPVPNKPGVSNWVEKHGGLPRYIERVAKHIIADSGYPVSRAIAAAISQTKKRAAKGNAQAAAAIAQWSRMKAAAGSAKNLANTDAAQLSLRFRAIELSGNYSQEGGRVTGTVNYGSGPSQKARATAQKKGQAFKSGRYPVRNVSDLKKAIKAFGRARDADKPAIKRFIMRRARALGATQLIPSSWTSTKSGSR